MERPGKKNEAPLWKKQYKFIVQRKETLRWGRGRGRGRGTSVAYVEISKEEEYRRRRNKKINKYSV